MTFENFTPIQRQSHVTPTILRISLVAYLPPPPPSAGIPRAVIWLYMHIPCAIMLCLRCSERQCVLQRVLQCVWQSMWQGVLPCVLPCALPCALQCVWQCVW